MNGTPNERMLQALKEIRDRPMPVRPSNALLGDLGWANKQYSILRRIAALALFAPDEPKPERVGLNDPNIFDPNLYNDDMKQPEEPKDE